METVVAALGVKGNAEYEVNEKLSHKEAEGLRNELQELQKQIRSLPQEPPKVDRYV